MLPIWMAMLGVVLHASEASRATRDPVAIYAPIVAQVRTEKPVWPGLRIVLDEVLNDSRVSDRATGVRTHSVVVLDRLKAGGWVDGLCSWPRTQSCAVSNDNAAIVRLGPIITLPDSTRIAADADVAVDVMLTTPCPAPPESERCRVPDAVEFRYFLRAEPDGTYRVMTRQLIGAI